MDEYEDEELDREVDELLAPLLGRIGASAMRVPESTVELTRLDCTACDEFKISKNAVEEAHRYWMAKDQKEKDATEERVEGGAARPTLVSALAKEMQADEMEAGGDGLGARRWDRGMRGAVRPARALTPIAQDGSMGIDERDWREGDEGSSRDGSQRRSAGKPARVLTPPDRNSGIGRSSGALTSDRRQRQSVARILDSPHVNELEQRGSRDDDVRPGEVEEMQADEEGGQGGEQSGEEPEGAAETAVDEAPAARRCSGRTQTVAKRHTEPPLADAPVKKPKLMKSADLPSKDFSLVVLLESGVTGEDGAVLLGEDGLCTEKRTALEEFWKAMIAKDQKLSGGRFNSWFKGSSFEEKCFAMIMGPRQKSAWEHGKGFACKYCVKHNKPCCRVQLDDGGKPVRVTVLPQAGKSGMGRFQYW